MVQRHLRRRYAKIRPSPNWAYAISVVLPIALMESTDGGGVANRPPSDSHMALVRSPDGDSIEPPQRGDALRQKNCGHSWPTPGRKEKKMRNVIARFCLSVALLAISCLSATAQAATNDASIARSNAYTQRVLDVMFKHAPE